MSEQNQVRIPTDHPIATIGGLQVRIEPTFLDLLRPLNDAERRNLKAALKADGRCVSDLIAAVFRSEPTTVPVLIDGHHRTQLVAEIRAEGGLIEEPTVFIKEFDTRFDAINYVANLQGGRRNWEPQDRIRFILEKTDYVQRLKAEALRRKRSGKRQVEAQKSQGRVDVQIALQANVSPTTVKQVRKVLESKNSAIIEQLFTPDPKQRIAIAEAAKRVGSARKAASIRARTLRLQSVSLPPLPKRSLLDQIICADVIDGLRTIRADSIQLTVTSPPYAVHGVKYDDGAAGERDWYDGNYASYLEWMRRVWAEVYRVTQPNGKIVLNIDAGNERDAAQQPTHGMVHNVYADISVIMREIGWVFRGEHCWFKQNSNGSRPNWGSYALCSNPRIRRNHEYLLVFQKGNGSLIGDRSLCDLTQAEFEQFTMSHWYVKAEQGLDPSHRDFHPCPFPHEIVYRSAKLYSYVGSTILDPFVGCGTTAYVAKALNRRFVGIDRSPLYCETAKRAPKTLDGRKTPERLASIKRFKVADDERADGYGKMEVDSLKARKRKAKLRQRA
ncbi:MAG: site-specific DNA-methyltransferase [Tepidisphaeraceae bacterium]